MLLDEKNRKRASPKKKRGDGSLSPALKRNEGNVSPKLSSKNRGGSKTAKMAQSLETATGSEVASRREKKSKSSKVGRKVSVSIKKNREEQM